MSLIEGVGDEVVQFFIIFLAALIALFAWWSTSISERPLMRTVLILERRAARRSTRSSSSMMRQLRDPHNPSPRGREPPTEEHKASQTQSEPPSRTETSGAAAAAAEASGEATNNEGGAQGTTETQPGADVATHESNTQTQDAEFDYDNDGEQRRRRRTRSRQSAYEGTEIQKHNKYLKNLIDESSTSSENKSNAEEGKIRIRLKYLNDDQKLVEGKLQEQLGEFKRRHFSLELAGRKLVRLIFNGKVLQHDSKTLQYYGFFDNCVVHCLIHQRRTPPPSPHVSRRRAHAQRNQQEFVAHHHWDLGNILFASLSFLLGLAWYGRYQYAQLYTATTTVALIGLTGMFTVSLIGMYMPDMDLVGA